MLSLRRRYVDAFLGRHARFEGPVLDLGGQPARPRGAFRLDGAVSLNLDPTTRPTVVGDGAQLPFKAGTFHLVVCSEVLEHVPDPQALLSEAARVLDQGGRLVLTAPFCHPIHADPLDFARYCPDTYADLLAVAGFERAECWPHGGFLAVVLDLLRSRCLRSRPLRALWRFAAWAAWKLDRPDPLAPTGFGIVAVKP